MQSDLRLTVRNFKAKSSFRCVAALFGDALFKMEDRISKAEVCARLAERVYASRKESFQFNITTKITD